MLPLNWFQRMEQADGRGKQAGGTKESLPGLFLMLKSPELLFVFHETLAESGMNTI